jgi:hypothetical protein
MTKVLAETIELPPLKEDYSFHPTLIPGDSLYERLKVQNPKKLKRMIDEERLIASYMNTPEALAMARETHKQAQDSLRYEYATRGPYYYWYQEHVKGKNQVTQADRDILGLNQSDILYKKDVRNAYRRKARKLHPDVGGDAESFKQLYAAYRTLLKIAQS